MILYTTLCCSRQSPLFYVVVNTYTTGYRNNTFIFLPGVKGMQTLLSLKNNNNFLVTGYKICYFTLLVCNFNKSWLNPRWVFCLQLFLADYFQIKVVRVEDRTNGVMRKGGLVVSWRNLDVRTSEALTCNLEIKAPKKCE